MGGHTTYSQIILDRLFVLCRLCSLGDVRVITIILYFITVNSVSLGPHHRPAQKFGGRLRKFGNRLRCHLWLTIHNRHAQSFSHICQVASVCMLINTLPTIPNDISINSVILYIAPTLHCVGAAGSFPPKFGQ